MNRKQANIPDFDDLIFESRNKDYGAYEIRKKYRNVLFFSVLIATIAACCAVIIPFLAEKSSGRVVAGRFKYVQVQLDDYLPPMDEILLSEPPAASSRLQELKYIPPEVVDTVNDVLNKLASTDEILAHQGDTTIDGSSAGYGDNLYGDGSAFGEAYAFVEQMPTFMGGDINKFRMWVQRRATCPQEAIEKDIRGRVVLTFIIERDGSVSNVTIVKGVHSLLDDEALRVISSSPKWNPGLQGGRAVRVRCSIALVF